MNWQIEAIKEVLPKAIEDSGTKPYWKHVWYAWVFTTVLVLIERVL